MLTYGNGDKGLEISGNDSSFTYVLGTDLISGVATADAGRALLYTGDGNKRLNLEKLR